MSDWIGLAVIAMFVIGALVGLKLLSRPQTRTAEEFERNAAENTTMLGAGMNALQELLDPAAAKSKEVQVQMKEGRYMKKKKEGKAGGTADTEEGISE
jgi:hypothetical protein